MSLIATRVIVPLPEIRGGRTTKLGFRNPAYIPHATPYRTPVQSVHFFRSCVVVRRRGRRKEHREMRHVASLRRAAPSVRLACCWCLNSRPRFHPRVDVIMGRLHPPSHHILRQTSGEGVEIDVMLVRNYVVRLVK